jgi:signal transduction histidine kinase
VIRAARYRMSMRLWVMFSVLTMVSAAASGLLLLYLARPFVSELRPPSQRQATVLLFAGTAVMAALGALSGLGLGIVFAGRVRGIVEKAEALTPHVGAPPVERPMVTDELGALDAAVGRLTLSMDRFVRDSDILARLPQGLLLLGPSARLTSFNAAAEQILGLPLGSFLAEPLTAAAGVFPPEQGNESLSALLREFEDGQEPIGTAEIAVTTAHERHLLIDVTVQRREWRDQGLLLVVLFRDASEKRRIREQIQKADQLAFLGGMAARVAHEIRTPLATARGLLELLQSDTPGGHARHAYFDHVLLALDRQEKLVQNLLTLSHPEPNACQAVSVPALLESVRGLMPPDGRLRWPGKAGPFLRAWGDPFRLSEVFANLIRNALEASPTDGEVEVRVEAAGPERVYVVVRNTGVGIPADLRERIFHPFFTTKTQGTGLGLAIARQIVEAHRGMLTVESDGKTWTTFTVELPSTPEAAGEPREAPKLASGGARTSTGTA